MVEIEVLSRETIKPSSPTPSHLRKYHLSFLDQVAPPIFMPLVLFYPADSDNTLRSDQLKKSLSEALSRFYPLAGRVIDNFYADCNDEGVPYVEARVNCQLSDVIRNPIPGELNKFLPYKLDDCKDLGLAIQVNFFDCGGMAVGVTISHKLADALSSFMFVNTWSSITRGDTDILSPHFESASLFPAKDIGNFKADVGIVRENIITKRFVFSVSKIASLRDKYAPPGGARHPTRIEALSAFVWSRFKATTQTKGDTNKIYTVLHAVNLRTRVDPPLPGNYFGNVSRIAIAAPTSEDEESGHGIVTKMREAICNINAEYIAKLRENDKHLNFLKKRAEGVGKDDMVSFSFTSLCRFPVHEADFGWGKPVWVGSTSLPFKNLTVFLDTQSGDGIEAWVNLKVEDMAKFEVDEELLSFASSSPFVKSYVF